MNGFLQAEASLLRQAGANSEWGNGKERIETPGGSGPTLTIR
jgi:hypothetical protein